MNIYKKIVILLLLTTSLSSCFLINPVEFPEVVISITDLQDKTVSISWPLPNDNRLGTVRFDVYINNNLVGRDQTTNTYTFVNLNPNTNYSISVIGKSNNYGNSDPALSSFTTKKEYIAIPDPKFESYLINQNLDTELIQNGKIFKEDAEKIISLNIQDLGINNLDGIQFFTKLEFLNCSKNNITLLNLNSNLTLKELYCSSNLLNSIILTNSKLITLDVSNNLLTNLSLGNLINLEVLKFNENQVSTISFANLTKLKSVACQSNKLSNLNFSPNTQLVDLNADNNLINSLNITQNLLLKNISVNNNLLTSLSLNSLNGLESLLCSFNNLSNLGLENKPMLKNLGCKNNQLTSLNLKSNPLLSILNCQNNPNLRTVCVSNIQNAINNFEWIIDSTMTYSLCN